MADPQTREQGTEVLVAQADPRYRNQRYEDSRSRVAPTIYHSFSSKDLQTGASAAAIPARTSALKELSKVLVSGKTEINAAVDKLREATPSVPEFLNQNPDALTTTKEQVQTLSRAVANALNKPELAGLRPSLTKLKANVDAFEKTLTSPEAIEASWSNLDPNQTVAGIKASQMLLKSVASLEGMIKNDVTLLTKTERYFNIAKRLAPALNDLNLSLSPGFNATNLADPKLYARFNADLKLAVTTLGQLENSGEFKNRAHEILNARQTTAAVIPTLAADTARYNWSCSDYRETQFECAGKAKAVAAFRALQGVLINIENAIQQTAPSNESINSQNPAREKLVEQSYGSDTTERGNNFWLIPYGRSNLSGYNPHGDSTSRPTLGSAESLSRDSNYQREVRRVEEARSLRMARERAAEQSSGGYYGGSSTRGGFGGSRSSSGGWGFGG